MKKKMLHLENWGERKARWIDRTKTTWYNITYENWVNWSMCTVFTIDLNKISNKKKHSLQHMSQNILKARNTTIKSYHHWQIGVENNTHLNNKRNIFYYLGHLWCKFHGLTELFLSNQRIGIFKFFLKNRIFSIFNFQLKNLNTHTYIVISQ